MKKTILLTMLGASTVATAFSGKITTEHSANNTQFMENAKFTTGFESKHNIKGEAKQDKFYAEFLLETDGRYVRKQPNGVEYKFDNIKGRVKAGYDDGVYGGAAIYDFSKIVGLEGSYKYELNDKSYLKNTLYLTFDKLINQDIKNTSDIALRFLVDVQQARNDLIILQNEEYSAFKSGLVNKLVFGYKHSDELDLTSTLNLGYNLTKTNASVKINDQDQKLDNNFNVFELGLNAKVVYTPDFVKGLKVVGKGKYSLETRMMSNKKNNKEFSQKTSLHELLVDLNTAYDIPLVYDLVLVPELGIKYRTSSQSSNTEIKKANEMPKKFDEDLPKQRNIILSPKVGLKYIYDNLEAKAGLGTSFIFGSNMSEKGFGYHHGGLTGSLSLGYSW